MTTEFKFWDALGQKLEDNRKGVFVHMRSEE